MKIGMMADFYKPHVSGVTNVIALSKQYLEAAGHDVYVFTFGKSGYQDDESNVVRSPGLEMMKGISLSLRYSSSARKLLQTMDLVHVHHPFLSGSLAMLYCRPKRIPIVFTNHTRYDLYARSYLPVVGDLVSDIAMEGFLPAFCRACDLVISPSDGMRQVLIEAGVDAFIDVVPNGVELQLFKTPVAPISRAELGFGEQDVLLFYVGRLGPEKNLKFLLRAFLAVLAGYPNAGLVLVGDGPEKSELNEWVKTQGIAERVRFTGQINYGQLPAYLAVGDGFVTASVTEVHPLTVIEAMASGLPVVGIQSPGVGDIIQDGVTGLICPVEDLAMYTAKMMRIVTDRDLRNKLSISAQEASNQYDIKNTIQLFINRYQDLIEKKAVNKKKSRRRFSNPK